MSAPLPLVLPDDDVIQDLPFYATIDHIDKFPELKHLNYELIDVKGDGNCGIYAVIIGRMARGLQPPKNKKKLSKLV